MISRRDAKAIARLQRKKYRLSEKKILLEGPRLILEAFRADWPVERIVHTQAFLDSTLAESVTGEAEQRNIPVEKVLVSDFKRFSTTVHSQGVVAIAGLKEWLDDPVATLHAQANCFFIAIEKLQDPGNLGTIIRTAEWLGADAAVLGPECVEWTNPKALRATMGAAFYLPIYESGDFCKFLHSTKQRGAVIYAADQKGDFPYTTLRYAPKKILLLGEEARGLSEQGAALADHKVVIPRRGSGESLNVAIAASILMAEMTR